MITLKLSNKSDEDRFRLIKAFNIFFFFHKKGEGVVKLVSQRRGIWRVEYKFNKDEVSEWIIYYLDYFLSYVRTKGLKIRNFESMGSWLFLFRELGELRFSDLSFDYYNWKSMWTIVLEKNEKRFYFSSLKLKYRIK